MRRFAVALSVGLISAALPVSQATAAPPTAESYVVILKDDVANPDAVAQEHARKTGAGLGHIYRSAMKGYSAKVAANKVDELRNDPRVELVGLDQEVQASAQTLPTGINRIEGDVSSTLSGNGSGSVSTGVAVIDTGSGPHSDLNIVGGVNCSSGKGYSDGNGHGTHVAGTIAAKDDGNGVVGVAPGAPIYSVRVLDNRGSGSYSAIVCGIDWVTANSDKIKVANMSLGGSGSDDGNCGRTNNDAMHRAICASVAKGVTHVVAAGNENTDLATKVPASYNEVLTVTAEADFNGAPGGGAAATCRADVDETAADFSNYTTPGSADVGHTVAAPGVCIDSTWKGGGYNSISGTSMASPHVAGVAALCIYSGGCAGSSPAQVISKLRSDAAAKSSSTPSYGFSGDPASPVSGRYYGYLTFTGGY